MCCASGPRKLRVRSSVVSRIRQFVFVAQVVLAPSVALVTEILEHAADLGHFVVVHLSLDGPGACGGARQDARDPLELLERIFFFCAGLSENFSSEPSALAKFDEKFRLFVLVDYRVPRYLPQWLLDSRAVVVFDGHSGARLRPWMHECVSAMRPMAVDNQPLKHAQSVASKLGSQRGSKRRSVPGPLPPEAAQARRGGRRRAGTLRHAGALALQALPGAGATVAQLFRESPLQLEGPLQRAADSAILSSPGPGTLRPLGLGSTALRLLVQLGLAALAAGGPPGAGSLQLLVGAPPELSAADGRAADELLCALLARSCRGLEALPALRLPELLEALSALVLRRGGGGAGGAGADTGHLTASAALAAPPALYSLLQGLQTALHQKPGELGGGGAAGDGGAGRQLTTTVALLRGPAAAMPGVAEEGRVVLNISVATAKMSLVQLANFAFLECRAALSPYFAFSLVMAEVM
ncbi:unnamed protein product [Prorocentrum cordatum]|uniref:Uncharacterized protein n=1 Tax=Prorocentrum cordatum TaxID=2364126 RepID=A0ABN9SXU5_9DINO|nr:unnamed protein product [Polarella glacialis]